MASQTSALPDGSTLTKPAYTDSADIAVINTNMDKIVSNINNISIQPLTSSEGIKTVALNSTRCPVNQVRWFNCRLSITSELPSFAQATSIARVTKRIDNTCFIELFTDGGETWTNAYNGSVWSGWEQLALRSGLGNLVMLNKSTASSSGDLTFTVSGRGAGFLIVSQNGLSSSIYEIHTTTNGGGLQFTKIGGRDVSITANDNVLTVAVTTWSNVYVIYGGLIS